MALRLALNKPRWTTKWDEETVVIEPTKTIEAGYPIEIVSSNAIKLDCLTGSKDALSFPCFIATQPITLHGKLGEISKKLQSLTH